VREAIRGLVQERPGVSFSDLLKALRGSSGLGPRVGNGSLAWHLQRLERAGLLRGQRSGRYHRYYPNQPPWTQDLAACAYVQVPNRWIVARALARDARLTVPEIQERLQRGMNTWQLRHLLRGLAAEGLVVRTRVGRRVVYEAAPRLARIVELLAPSQPSTSGPLPEGPPRPGLPPVPGAGPAFFPNGPVSA